MLKYAKTKLSRQSLMSLAWLLTGFLIYMLWAGLEKLFYGEVQPRAVDNVIAAILWVSVFLNVRQWIDKKGD